MTPDLVLWVVARSSGTASFVALSISLLTGMALRGGVLTWLTHNRGVRELHDFTSTVWLPLGLAHVGGLLLDSTAQVGLRDLVIPFGVAYGRIPIGLGTISLQLLAVVTVSSWLRGHFTNDQWLSLHRLSYVAFATLFAHSVLSGTDFAQPLVSVVAWSTVLGLAAVFALRLLRGTDRRGDAEPAP